jgi:diketogulonate reductase-like aldo/keto reductase
MIGLGCNPCKAELISLAIDLGVTLFDTAEIYDEEEVGRGIAGKRDKVFLATKVAPQHLHYTDLKAALLRSLKRLGTDHVDLYMIHWPNPDIPLEESMSAMQRLVENKLVGHVGLCNCDVAYLREVCKWVKIDYVEVEYNLLDRSIEKSLLPMCKNMGIKVIAYSPLKWTGDYTWISYIAEDYGRTHEQVVLQFLVEQGVIPIPSTTNEQHLRDIASARFYMPQNIVREIKSFYPDRTFYMLPSEVRGGDGGDFCPSPQSLAMCIPADFKPIKVKGKKLIEGGLRYQAWKLRYGNLPIPALEVR